MSSNVKMKLPNDIGAFSIRGMELEIAKDKTVMVPSDAVAEAEAFGLTKVEEEPKSGK